MLLPEGWDHVVPARDPVPFTLHGRGTGDVERFSSGLARLAWQRYWQPPGAFVIERMADALGRRRVKTGDDADRRSYFARILANGPSSLNTHGRYASTWVAATHATTAWDLTAGTLLGWGPGVLSPRDLCHDEGAVCTTCLAEMPTDAVYEKLLWSFKDVVACVRHRALLLRACPACERPLPCLAYRSRPGHCGHCDEPLFAVRTPSIATLGEGGAAWQSWVTDQLHRVLEVGQSLAEPPTGAGIADVVAKVLDDERLSYRELGDLVGRSKGEVCVWRSGTTVPSLPSVLRVAAVSGLDVAAFLEGRREASLLVRPPVIPTFSERHVPTDYALAELLMRRALENWTDPPPLLDILEQTRIDGRALRRSLGPLCRAVVAHHKQWEKAQRPVRHEERRQAMLRTFRELVRPGQRVSRRTIEGIAGFNLRTGDLDKLLVDLNAGAVSTDPSSTAAA